MNAIDARKQIQALLHVSEDGIIGPKTLEALTHLSGLPDDALWPAQSFQADGAVVKATSFADPADVAAFQRCKSEGNSDSFCFSKGDNGIGKWGDSCVAGTGPACALPPEDWQRYGAAARKKAVIVTNADNGKTVTCELRDTMPHQANIKNGAAIDLNPDACEALGIPIPADARVTWKWA